MHCVLKAGLSAGCFVDLWRSHGESHIGKGAAACGPMRGVVLDQDAQKSSMADFKMFLFAGTVEVCQVHVASLISRS